ncbi:PVC-type heme-binding CxxCH protein [Dyadobacter sp. CY323]|uniref:PVC-type heme-binding CxxCH protein n=1 Tax=Dyadobacter sp. CY323 TaxID=2907302 RepID=UPI001F2C7898|nr:PVC-type heme-binding CxxCH protein [Dyadobacter sp. CY323]MCE6989798.1 c-type cytochrome [Dyadobacter sp. CY323]
MKIPDFKIFSCIFTLILISGCQGLKKEKPTDLSDIAVNEEVAKTLREFEGMGALSDNSAPTAASAALNQFKHPDDLELDLILAEPKVRQPVFMNFDHRGRLWVVHYNQYPYPKGLKVEQLDNYLRIKYDKVPGPPPDGNKGADRITIHEDTDGDGRYDKETDAITGLNIVTSVTLGRKKIWVLNPPYLLAYPDPNDDGIPDGKPEVHLEGFGMEDTHAVANSLRWGPDGWLYGAQGSTTTANISSKVSKNVAFQGQVIWRYHPETTVFEVFGEGGGNTFYIEIDDKGRLYSGDNGTSRGMYYKQGGYYNRNLDKHGPYTNPYTFGYLPSMDLTGDKKRFTHGWVRYQGGSLPTRYNDKMIAINPLQGYVQLTAMTANGSSFSNKDEERILTTDDRWFRPVDIKSGPDGAIYLADWYDSRLSHVDARDTWHKTSGRIYRLRNKNAPKTEKFDLKKYSGDELIALFSNPNRWFQQESLRILGDRKDKTLLPKLTALLRDGTGQIALQALWAINLTEGFDHAMAEAALTHKDPFVRMWGVRLIGDSPERADAFGENLIGLAATESHPEVRSQLASTAKRMPDKTAVSVLEKLIRSERDSNDPDIPLLIWWALESKLGANTDKIVTLFSDESLWNVPIVNKHLSGLLVRRLVMENTAESFSACVKILKAIPKDEYRGVVLNGLQKGLLGSDFDRLSEELTTILKSYAATSGGGLSSAMLLKQGDSAAFAYATKLILDNRAETRERVQYIQILGELRTQKCIPVLLNLVETSQTSVLIKQEALRSLQQFEGEEIAAKVIGMYLKKLNYNKELQSDAIALLVSRAVWAHQLLSSIESGKGITKKDINSQMLLRLKMIDDPKITSRIDALWPENNVATSAEKTEKIKAISAILQKGQGNIPKGKELFANTCGSCHRLFDEGGDIGPDLTGYDRRNVNNLLLNTLNPNADIREGYVYYHVTTKDGRILLGKLIDRSGSTITFRPIGGRDLTLSQKEIVKMEAQKTSMMPERLLDDMTDAQIRDLFSYITRLNR